MLRRLERLAIRDGVGSRLIAKLGFGDEKGYWARRYLAMRYLRGRGVEIGPLNEPLPVFRFAKVLYIDHFEVNTLREHYPELVNEQLVKPDVIADGESLACFRDGVLDFIIANHFIEHCEDPIRTLEAFLSKLRTGGVIYLAVPNKNYSFDRDRSITTVEHLLDDYHHGAERERIQHYWEWVRYVKKITAEEKVKDEVFQLMSTNYSIHFHVWDDDSFERFLMFLNTDLQLPFNLIASERWYYFLVETIFVLQKV